MFTQEQILEIKQRLRETSAKDTEFHIASLPLGGDEIIAIVQGGENKKFPISLFFESFSQYIDGSERVDFFNVSRYVQITQDYPEVARLTLLEAIESCPEDVRRPGQVITFMDNNDYWVTWQYNGDKKEQWLDIDYWEQILTKPKQELGDGEDALLSQKVITDNINNLQEQINAIVADKATVALNASPATVFVGVENTISLNATTTTSASSIKIKKGSTQLASGSGMSLSGSDTITPSNDGNTTYTAEFVIAGLNKSTTKNVVAVYPIFYGALAEYDVELLTKYGVDASHPDGTPTTTVKRSYTLTLDSTRRYIYFKVPKRNITGITSVGMGSGAEISPVSGGYVSELEDNNYKVWKSDDGFTGSGTQVFTVS